jgi:hypothetical protein
MRNTINRLTTTVTACLWLVVVCVCSYTATAQTTDSTYLLLKKPYISKDHQYFEMVRFLTAETIPSSPIKVSIIPARITGNLLYEYQYRSLVDTPFATAHLMQHYLQSNLWFTALKKYPVQVVLSGRFTNSPLFRNYLDVNVLFNNSNYKEQLRSRLQQLYRQATQQVTTQYQQIYNTVLAKQQQINQLDNWLEHDYQLQRLTECRERLMQTAAEKAKQLAAATDTALTARADSTPSYADSAATGFIQEYERKRQLKDSLLQQTAVLKNRYFETKEKTETLLQEQHAKLNKARSLNDLERHLKENGISKDSLPKNYRLLFALKRLNIGRSVVNYSPLTVSNIVLTGVNIELNPGFYYAVAAGRVNYQFRDFVLQNRPDNHQHLGLVRFGYGDIDKNHVVATAYTGRKDQFNMPGNNGSSRIFGFSVTGNVQLGAHQRFTAEVAKSSTTHVFNNGVDYYTKSPRLRFADKHSLAWLVQSATYIPATRTRLNGFIQKMGADFQSFSLFPSGTNRLWWRLAVQQPLLKNKIQLNTAVSKNEFSNPFILQRYKTNAVFASLYATVRIKKLPVLSAGYIPTSQYSLVNSQISESRFYSLFGSATHLYRIKNIYASSVLLMSKYYNKGSDSGFIYYNASNIMFNQYFTGKKCRWNSGLIISASTAYRLLTADQGLLYQFTPRLNAGGGMKYNQPQHQRSRMGYYGSMNMNIKQLGDFSFSFEHGFLPAPGNGLQQNDIGRITYYKNF